MTHRTFGAGGDDAGIVEAWTYLASVSPLDDNYVYRQVGNCTVNNNWPNQSLAVNRVDLNGHSVKFYCPYANSHKGDPTKGY